MKKIKLLLIPLLVITFILSTTIAYAKNDNLKRTNLQILRASLCPECGNTTLLRTKTLEYERYNEKDSRPCIHGYSGYDVYTCDLYRITLKCTSCGYYEASFETGPYYWYCAFTQ